MIPLPDKSSASLTWKPLKKSRKREFVLLSGSKVVARLQWAKRYGSLAMGESLDGRWTFKRTGFFATQITVRPEGSRSDIALFLPNWRGQGKLVLKNGRQFTLKTASFWKGSYRWVSHSGQTVLSTTPEGVLWQRSLELKFGRSTMDSATRSILAILALYIGLLAAQDSEEAGAVVVAIG